MELGEEVSMTEKLLLLDIEHGEDVDQKVIEDAAQESGDNPRGSLAPPSILENLEQITRSRGLDARRRSTASGRRGISKPGIDR